MNKKFIFSFLFLSVLAISFASAGFFQNIFSSSTGNAIIEPGELDVTPRISYWWGKVNQHTENGVWKTDPDGKSGALLTLTNAGRLSYCQKWYPDTVEVREYAEEYIFFKAAGNQGEYPSVRTSYECVQSEVIDGGNAEENEEFCTDSDGGNNIWVKGKINYYSLTALNGLDLQDYCIIPSTRERVHSCEGPDCTVLEYYCVNSDGYMDGSGDFYGSRFYPDNSECPNGCSDGACIKDSGTINQTTSDVTYQGVLDMLSNAQIGTYVEGRTTTCNAVCDSFNRNCIFGLEEISSLDGDANSVYSNQIREANLLTCDYIWANGKISNTKYARNVNCLCVKTPN